VAGRVRPSKSTTRNKLTRADRSARPLHDAVICCTSVLAEKRVGPILVFYNRSTNLITPQSQYAEYALQMGADHKLDLTSDVTHLLVGDTDTPKYKYVAREREDVKVLRPEWIEAVREAYMADAGVDLNALETEYRLPTFAGLTICITGFDDLALRARLQQMIDEEGGKYTGDLTKHVTHLVAAKPEGKKYQYALQWQKKIVTLNWLQDSIERKMQLDEAKYHPSIHPNQQGVGAWNKEAKYANQLGKRSRPQDLVAAEPSRKLRRTASAKLSSQNDGIWADINENSGADPPEREPLRPSRSMPAIRPGQAPGIPDQEPMHLQAREQAPGAGSKQPRMALMSHGYLDECYFCIEDFDGRKTAVLKGILLEEGGTVFDDLQALFDLEHVPAERCFLLVPYNTRATTATEAANQNGRCQIVTELWLEICMERKQCVDPHSYPLGKLLPRSGDFKSFEGLSMNSSGFPGIQRNHVAKVIQATGARYDEIFKPGLSVMICYLASTNIEKMCHAREWKIPIVTLHWLWASLHVGAPVPFEKYAIGDEYLHTRRETDKKQSHMGNSFANEGLMVEAARYQALADDIPTQPLPRKVAEEKIRPGSDFLTEQGAEDRAEHRGHNPHKAKKDADTHKKPGQGTEPGLRLGRDLSLQETDGNSPPKARSSSPKKRKPLFQTLDGASSIPEPNVDDQNSNTAPHPLPASNQDSQTTELLNGAIQDLLNQRGRTKSSTSTSGQSNKQPISRALSNVSNASTCSRAKASRAGSVSSVNTDGLGSEIAMEPSEPSRAASSSRGRGSFTGRAKARDESQQAMQKPVCTELNDPGLYCEDFAEEEIVPQQLTQLGYEDPEEAVALRAKLAEKRRKQTRAGQEDANPEQLKGKARLERRIRDDDTILDAKWAGGRRTRHKDRTPPGLKGLNDF
jgi:DNA replication regulator DPB11